MEVISEDTICQGMQKFMSQFSTISRGLNFTSKNIGYAWVIDALEQINNTKNGKCCDLCLACRAIKDLNYLMAGDIDKVQGDYLQLDNIK